MPIRNSSTLELSATFSNAWLALLALVLAIWQGKPIKMFFFFFLVSTMTELLYPIFSDVLLTASMPVRDTWLSHVIPFLIIVHINDINNGNKC